MALKGLCVLLLSVVVGTQASVAVETSGYEPLVYDRKYMDAITEESLWSSNSEFHEKHGPRGSSSHTVQIDGDYFDSHIFSRWGNQWLAGDTTWVIAFGNRTPWAENYQFSLAARSIKILCDHFYQDRKDIRFGIVDYHEWEDIKITLGSSGPTYVVLKDGMTYHSTGALENYVKVHEFLEKTMPSGQYRRSEPVQGRITPIGKYLFYYTKEVAAGQDVIVKYAEGWLTFNEAPEWAWSIFNFYKDQTASVQMLINILIVCYLICMQYYFFRHMVCESCFREWHDLNADVKRSEKNLAERQKAFEDEKARRQSELEERQRKASAKKGKTTVDEKESIFSKRKPRAKKD